MFDAIYLKCLKQHLMHPSYSKPHHKSIFYLSTLCIRN